MKNKKFFTELALITVTASLVSNILAVKQFTFWNLSLPTAMLVFPIIYIVSDVASEVYGYKASRKVAWYGFFANLFMVLMFQLAIMLPYPEYFENQEAFKTILGNTPRIFIAGQITYIVGDWTNDLTFKIMKEKGGNSFKLRAIISSMVGEFFDSGLFYNKMMSYLPLPSPDILLNDQDKISSFEVLSTPGHTPGSICLLNREEKILFSGDTLFKASIGRTDLQNGNFTQIISSLQKLKKLDEDILVLPGHGPSTTIGFEKKNNSYL